MSHFVYLQPKLYIIINIPNVEYVDLSFYP